MIPMTHQDFSWLLNRFVKDTPGVLEAVAVSSDGFRLASSVGVDQPTGQQFAAIVSGLASLTAKATESFGIQPAVRLMIEAVGGFVIVNRINDRSALGVIVAPDADLGLAAYEMALFCDQAGEALSPAAIASLKNVLSV
jgi:uncharacterized protein